MLESASKKRFAPCGRSHFVELAESSIYLHRSPRGVCIGDLSIADDPRFVDVFTGESNIGRGRNFTVLLRNTEITSTAICFNFTALLRRVVFISEPTLGLRFNAKMQYETVGSEYR